MLSKKGYFLGGGGDMLPCNGAREVKTLQQNCSINVFKIIKITFKPDVMLLSTLHCSFTIMYGTMLYSLVFTDIIKQPS